MRCTPRGPLWRGWEDFCLRKEGGGAARGGTDGPDDQAAEERFQGKVRRHDGMKTAERRWSGVDSRCAGV